MSANTLNTSKSFVAINGEVQHVCTLPSVYQRMSVCSVNEYADLYALCLVTTDIVCCSVSCMTGMVLSFSEALLLKLQCNVWPCMCVCMD